LIRRSSRQRKPSDDRDAAGQEYNRL